MYQLDFFPIKKDNEVENQSIISTTYRVQRYTKKKNVKSIHS